MKNLKAFLSVLCFLICSTPNIYAQDSQLEKSKPCLEIKKACEAAGFTKGQHKEGKGLYKDCMQKLSNGEAVLGVNLSSDLISACKQKRVDHSEKKKN